MPYSGQHQNKLAVVTVPVGERVPHAAAFLASSEASSAADLEATAPSLFARTASPGSYFGLLLGGRTFPGGQQSCYLLLELPLSFWGPQLHDLSALLLDDLAPEDLTPFVPGCLLCLEDWVTPLPDDLAGCDAVAPTRRAPLLRQARRFMDCLLSDHLDAPGAQRNPELEVSAFHHFRLHLTFQAMAMFLHVRHRRLRNAPPAEDSALTADARQRGLDCLHLRLDQVLRFYTDLRTREEPRDQYSLANILVYMWRELAAEVLPVPFQFQLYIFAALIRHLEQAYLRNKELPASVLSIFAPQGTGHYTLVNMLRVVCRAASSLPPTSEGFHQLDALWTKEVKGAMATVGTDLKVQSKIAASFRAAAGNSDSSSPHKRPRDEAPSRDDPPPKKEAPPQISNARQMGQNVVNFDSLTRAAKDGLATYIERRLSQGDGHPRRPPRPDPRGRGDRDRPDDDGDPGRR